MNNHVEKKLSGVVSSALGINVCANKSKKGNCTESSDGSVTQVQDGKRDDRLLCSKGAKVESKTKTGSSDNEFVDKLRLKTALKVLRSNLSAEEKLSAIKRSRDALHRIEDDVEHENGLQELLQIDLNLSGTDIKQRIDKPSGFENKSNEPENNPRPASTVLFCKEVKSSQLDLHGNSNPNANTEVPVHRSLICSTSVVQCANSLTDDCIEKHHVRIVDVVQTDNVYNKPPPAERLVSARHSFKNRSLTTCSIKKNVDGITNDIVNDNTLQTSNADVAITYERMSKNSPVHVQQWIESIDSCQQQNEQESSLINSYFNQDISNSTEKRISFIDEENNVELQYEAHNLPDPFSTSEEESIERCDRPRKHTLLQMKEKQDSFQSDVSNLSNSSLSSIDTLLESRKQDPEEILINLGFGGNPDVNSPLSRIPERFLQPSQVKGNNFDELIRQETTEVHDCTGRFHGKVPSWLESSFYSCSLDETSSKSSNSDLPISTATVIVSNVACSEAEDSIANHFSEETTFHAERDISQRTCIVTIKVEDVG